MASRPDRSARLHYHLPIKLLLMVGAAVLLWTALLVVVF
jgi:hypothetical protein